MSIFSVTHRERPRTDESPSNLCELPADKLVFLPFAERKSRVGLPALAKSISQLGVLQPVTVRRRPDGAAEVVCGQRRVLAARLAGVRSIPCLVTELSDSGAYAARLSSMIHTAAADEFVAAEMLGSFCKEFHFGLQKAAVLLGITKEQAAESLRLLEMSESQRNVMSKNGLTAAHALIILNQPTSRRGELIEVCVKNGFSPNELSRYIRSLGEEERLRRSYQRRAAALSDTRLFFNTVERAVKVLRLAGVNILCEKQEHDEFTEMKIIVPHGTSR